MEKNFNHNMVKLQKQINDLSYGINKVRYKNHRTMSNIVEKLKQISNNTSLSNNEKEEHKCSNKVLGNEKKLNDVLFSYKKRINNNKQNIQNLSVKNSFKKQEIKKTQNPIEPFNHKNNNHIQKLTKTLKNNENNDDDILLSENNVINHISNNYKKYICTEEMNLNNKKNKTATKKSEFNNNNGATNLSNNMSDDGYNINKNDNINNYFNPTSYNNKSFKNNYTDNINTGQKLENNSIRFKLLKNIKDEIEDINFKNDIKNSNNINAFNINKNKLYIVNEINSSNRNKTYHDFLPNKKRSNSINNKNNNLNKDNNFINNIDDKKNQIKKNNFLEKNLYNRTINYKTKLSDINHLDRNINNNKYDNKTYFEYNKEPQINHKLITLDNIKNNKKYIINNKTIINDINYNNYKNDDNFFNKDINNEILNNKINTFIQEKNNNNIKNNYKNKIYTQTKSKNYLNKNKLIIKQILKLKEKNDLDELINWIKKVKEYHNFVNTIKNLYNIYNINNYNNNNIYDILLSWINETIKKNQNIKIYESYCKNIINNNKLNNIDEFKFFMNQVLNKNKKNTKFLKGMKKICQDNFVPKVIKGNNINDIYYENDFLYNEEN